METTKKRMHSRMRRLCREALHQLARERGLQVVRESGHHHIVGAEGHISELPHGEAFHTGFEPGYGAEADWESFFKRGVVLSWVHEHPFSTGDNFCPTKCSEVDSVMKLLAIAPAAIQAA